MTVDAMGLEQRDLPAGWKWARLGDVCDASSGGTPKRGVDGFWGGPIIWAKIADMTSAGKYIFETEENITVKAIEESSAKIFPADTVLVAMYGSIGKSSIVKTPLATNQAILGCVCSEQLLPEFLWAWFRLFESNLLAMGRGGTQDNVNAGIIKDLDFPLPPLSEQKRIAAILNKQMAAVEKARQASEERLEAAKALPAAYLRDVFEGEESQTWPKKAFGQAILSITNGFGRRPKAEEEGPIVLRIADVSSGRVDLSNPRRVAMTNDETTKYGLTADDLLFIRVNGSIGYVGKCIRVPETKEPLAFNDHLIRVRIQDTFSTAFLSYFFQSMFVREHITQRASTSAGQFTINQKAISEITVPMVNNERQEQLANELRDKFSVASSAAEAIRQELDTIEAIPASLLRQAFSGAL